MGKAQGKRMLKRIRGPKLRVGPSGVRMQGPGFTRPAVPGGRSVDLMKLRKPGTGAPMPQMPLMPNQVVFRHKAWLPWWVAVLIPLLLLLALLLFLFLPRNVVVPDVTGTKSAFEAEKKLTKAQLKLAPTPKEKVSTAAAPGTVIGQTPAAGEKAKKDSDVTIEIAVGNGKVQVPDIVGKTQAEADPILEKANLTAGQVQPQPPDPKAKIESQIPAAKEVVKEGKPINIFLATIKDKKNGDKAKRRTAEAAAAVAAPRPRRSRCPRWAARWAMPRRRRPTPGSCRSRSPSSRPRRRARSSAPSRPRAPSSRRATRSRSWCPAASRS